MKKQILFALIAALVAGCSNIRPIGKINGITVTKITTRSIFSPATTTLVAADETKPGHFEVMSSASGPGVLPAVATAGGIVGAAAVLRPARNENSSGSSASSDSHPYTSSAAVGNGAIVPPPVLALPPGLINNPGHQPHH